MTDECYWNHPLKGKDGRVENGSKKYRDYYFEKNGNVTNQEIADHFNVGISTIENHKSNYQYDKVLSDKKAYEQKIRQQEMEEDYQQHRYDDNKNVKIALNIKYAQIEIAAMKIGIIPKTKTLPEELSFDKAWDTINRIGIDTLQKVIMRNYEQPGTINSSQKLEHAGEIELNPRLRKFLNENNVQ
ncbi:hypothetical protein [Methanobrevibacter sp.]|uniref:hypothetical protein n=1 Tax=Methanobrevibacter sp. TaxID=66852 RepID=UPI00388E7CD6